MRLFLKVLYATAILLDGGIGCSSCSSDPEPSSLVYWTTDGVTWTADDVKLEDMPNNTISLVATAHSSSTNSSNTVTLIFPKTSAHFRFDAASLASATYTTAASSASETYYSGASNGALIGTGSINVTSISPPPVDVRGYFEFTGKETNSTATKTIINGGFVITQL
jgi:hypothetical protein